MSRFPFSSDGIDKFPPDVRKAVVSIIRNPLPLPPDDVADLARGRIGMICGPMALPHQRDRRLYELATMAAVEGRDQVSRDPKLLDALNQ